MSDARAIIEAENPKAFLKNLAKPSKFVFMTHITDMNDPEHPRDTTQYFSDELSDWDESWEAAAVYDLKDYVKDGVLDLINCPMGAEALIFVNGVKEPVRQVNLDDETALFKVVDSYVPDEHDEEMGAWNPVEEAEDPKAFLRQGMKWKVVPIEGTEHMVTLYFEGKEVYNISLNAHMPSEGSGDPEVQRQVRELRALGLMRKNNDPGYCQELSLYLSWLQLTMPWYDRNEWISNWLREADGAGMPERYTQETGRAAFKRDGKVGVMRVKLTGFVEAEDPKGVFKSLPRPGYLVFWTVSYEHNPQGEKLYLAQDGSWVEDIKGAEVQRLTGWLNNQGEWRVDDFPAETVGVVLTNAMGEPQESYGIDELHRVDTTYYLQADPKPMRWQDDDTWEMIGPNPNFESEDPKAFIKNLPRSLWMTIEYVDGQPVNQRVPVKVYSVDWQHGTEVGLEVPDLNALVTAGILNQEDADNMAEAITFDLNNNEKILLFGKVGWESHVEFPDGHELAAIWKLEAPADVVDWMKRKMSREGDWSPEEGQGFVRRFGEARFSQDRGSDFSYGSDGHVVYFTPLNEKADIFINNLIMPGTWLVGGGYVSPPQYAQQILVQAGDAGLVGRRVMLDVYDLQHFRPPLQEEDPKSVLKAAKNLNHVPVCPLSGSDILACTRHDHTKEIEAWQQSRSKRIQTRNAEQLSRRSARRVREAEDPKSVFKQVSANTSEERLRKLVSTDHARFASVHLAPHNNFFLSIETMGGHVVMDIGPFSKAQLDLFKKEWYGFKDAKWEGWYKAMNQAGYFESEDPKQFLKNVGDYVVKWSFGDDPNCRYRIVRKVAGPKEAVEKWKTIDTALFAKAPPGKPPTVVKVYRYRDALAREKKQESEDPKAAFKGLPRHGWRPIPVPEDQVKWQQWFENLADPDFHLKVIETNSTPVDAQGRDLPRRIEHLAHLCHTTSNSSLYYKWFREPMSMNAACLLAQEWANTVMPEAKTLLKPSKAPEPDPDAEPEVDWEGPGVYEAADMVNALLDGEDPKTFLRTVAPRLWRISYEMTLDNGGWSSPITAYMRTNSKKEICAIIHKRYPRAQLAGIKAVPATPREIERAREHDLPVMEGEDPKQALRAAAKPKAGYDPDILIQMTAFYDDKPVSQVLVVNNTGGGYWLDITSGNQKNHWGPLDRDSLEMAKRMPELAQAEWLGESMADDIAKEAEKAEQPKSQEQADAGNQKKGHIHLHGWAIAIENAKDSIRKSKDPENPWQVVMPAHYGYIKGTEGKDKDHIDVYIGEHPSSMLAFVVNQVTKEGKFDEHKIMLGFKSKDEAIATYDKAFNGDLGPKLRKDVISATIDQVKHWLRKGDPKKEYANLEEAESPKGIIKSASETCHICRGPLGPEATEKFRAYNAQHQIKADPICAKCDDELTAEVMALERNESEDPKRFLKKQRAITWQELPLRQDVAHWKCKQYPAYTLILTRLDDLVAAVALYVDRPDKPELAFSDKITVPVWNYKEVEALAKRKAEDVIRRASVQEAEDPKSAFKHFNKTPEDILTSYGFELVRIDPDHLIQTWTKVTDDGWWRARITRYDRNPHDPQDIPSAAGHIEWQLQLHSWANDEVLKDFYGSGFGVMFAELRRQNLNIAEGEDPKHFLKTVLPRMRLTNPDGLIPALNDCIDELRGAGYDDRSKVLVTVTWALQLLQSGPAAPQRDRDAFDRYAQEVIRELKQNEFNVQADDLHLALHTLRARWQHNPQTVGDEYSTIPNFQEGIDSLAEKLLEAEDPKAFIKSLPRKVLPNSKVKIAVRFIHDHNWSTRVIPVIWHKGMVSTGEGWMAGIDINHGDTPQMPGLTDDQWEEILELVEYHLMEGDGEDDGYFEWEPEDERGVPYDRVEWKFMTHYLQSQRQATDYFGGVIL